MRRSLFHDVVAPNGKCFTAHLFLDLLRIPDTPLSAISNAGAFLSDTGFTVVADTVVVRKGSDNLAKTR